MQVEPGSPQPVRGEDTVTYHVSIGQQHILHNYFTPEFWRHKQVLYNQGISSRILLANQPNSSSSKGELFLKEVIWIKLTYLNSLQLFPLRYDSVVHGCSVKDLKLENTSEDLGFIGKRSRFAGFHFTMAGDLPGDFAVFIQVLSDIINILALDFDR